MFTDMMKAVKASVELIMNAWDYVHPGTAVGTTQTHISETAAKVQSERPNDDAAFAKRIAEYKAHAAEAEENKQKSVTGGIQGMMGLKDEFSPEVVDAYVASLRRVHDSFGQASEGVQADVLSMSIDSVSASLKYSMDHHQDALSDDIIKMIVGNKNMAQALHDGTNTIEHGANALMKMIADKAPEIAKQLQLLGGSTIAKGGNVKPPDHPTYISGGIHIKQDFKDQDPDRIALVFRKELSKAAQSRTMSRNGGPFGL